jgi:hypothetical protein
MHDPTEQIKKTQATGAEVEGIVRQMSEVLDGQPQALVLMGCLATTLIIQHPEITPEQLASGIRGASAWIATFLTSLNEENLPKEKIN